MGGAGNDYQVSVAIPASAALTRVATFERLGGGFGGDLWVTHSQDGGASWSVPALANGPTAKPHHPSLVEGHDGGWLLFHRSNVAGSFLIYRATSEDGLAFTARGATHLEWASGGETKPQVTRLQEGRLLLTYPGLGGPTCVAVSDA